jgi:hypothetical protein
MNLPNTLPYVAAALFIVANASHAAREQPRLPWQIPALASAAFLGFSVYAGLSEGPLGFWVEHTRNLWGNQIWLDLLLAASVGWALMLPRARAVGMRPLPWLAVVALLGSIGFLAMLARLFQLEQRA